jgi:hypothetical protein
VIGDRRYLSPSEDIILQAGYHLVVEPEPTQEELLEQAKMEKIAEIERYDRSDAVNLFYLAGQPMWLDARTRQTLRISIDSYVAMGKETVTKWFGGNQFTFPTNVWLQMLNALEVYAAEALNVTESHKADVMALDSIEDVEAYDITAGYPEKLNLTTEWLRLQQ